MEVRRPRRRRGADVHHHVDVVELEALRDVCVAELGPHVGVLAHHREDPVHDLPELLGGVEWASPSRGRLLLRRRGSRRPCLNRVANCSAISSTRPRSAIASGPRTTGRSARRTRSATATGSGTIPSGPSQRERGRDRHVGRAEQAREQRQPRRASGRSPRCPPPRTARSALRRAAPARRSRRGRSARGGSARGHGLPDALGALGEDHHQVLLLEQAQRVVRRRRNATELADRDAWPTAARTPSSRTRKRGLRGSGSLGEQRRRHHHRVPRQDARVIGDEQRRPVAQGRAPPPSP